MSSGRTFKLTTPGQNITKAIVDLAGSPPSQAESIADRWAINVTNLDASNTINVGRQGAAFQPLTPGQQYRFEGCAYRDICVNDAGNAVSIMVDGSDTVQERFAPLLKSYTPR